MPSTFIDPYKHFFALNPPKVDGDEEFEDITVEWDENLNINENSENIEIHLSEQFAEAEKTRNPWLVEAMKHDPAFMIDPINDYYKKLLPKEVVDSLTNEELEPFLALYDPVTWGKLYLRKNHNGWRPRVSRSGIPYQSQMIRCKSKRMAGRAGRRIGKSLAAIVRVLHKAFTFTETDNQSHYNIVIFTPNQSQINTLFKMMEFLIDNNPVLMEMVVTVQGGKRIPTRKTPNYMLELTNGVTITGYVSGSTAVRSSAANLLVLDEASFLETEDTDAVIALLAENEDVELWVSSTPKGLKDYFYERVHDKNFVSFYFPTDRFHPHWSLKMMQEFKEQLTSAGYNHEILADFSADGEGVFQLQFVDAIQKDYRYEDQHPEEDCFYGLGVDWNDAANGTQIYVGRFSLATQKFRIVDKESVNIQGWTQLTAVKKIRELVRKWRPVVVYADYGHGSTQIELLHEWGMKAPMGSAERILTKAREVNFSSLIEVYDLFLKKKVKKPAKAYLVNNAIRVVENNFIEISKYDTTLVKQMEGYVIVRYTNSGIPVYAADEKVGDHALDAVMLMLLGFNLEYSSMGKPKLNEKSNFTETRLSSATRSSDGTPSISDHDRRLLKDKEYERQIYEDAHATSNGRRQSFGRRRAPSLTKRPLTQHRKRF